MSVLDASVLIAYFGDDVHTPRASALLAKSEGSRALHPVTLAEVLTGPARIGAEEDVRHVIDAIGVDVISPDDDEPILAARIRAATGLKLPDCYPVAAAITRQSALATFDAQLARVARGLGVEVVGG
ncbi:MAG TPA: PIN domain-containing protein [Microbacterium sp.]|nr:PIN domain-containing protein [Microbacterium sp.]